MMTEEEIEEENFRSPFRNKIKVSGVEFQWMQTPIYKILEDYEKCIKGYLSHEESLSKEQEDYDLGFLRNTIMKKILDLFTYK